MMHPLVCQVISKAKKIVPILGFIAKCKTRTCTFYFSQKKKAWELWNEIIKNSQHWTQNEINLHKLINKMINANWNQNGVRTKSWQTHSHNSPWPTLGRNPHFFLNSIFVHGNGNYIQWQKISQTPKWKTFKKIQNCQVKNLTISQIYNFCIWILIWESSKAKL